MCKMISYYLQVKYLKVKTLLFTDDELLEASSALRSARLKWTIVFCVVVNGEKQSSIDKAEQLLLSL